MESIAIILLNVFGTYLISMLISFVLSTTGLLDKLDIKRESLYIMFGILPIACLLKIIYIHIFKYNISKYTNKSRLFKLPIKGTTQPKSAWEKFIQYDFTYIIPGRIIEEEKTIEKQEFVDTKRRQISYDSIRKVNSQIIELLQTVDADKSIPLVITKQFIMSEVMKCIQIVYKNMSTYDYNAALNPLVVTPTYQFPTRQLYYQIFLFELDLSIYDVLKEDRRYKPSRENVKIAIS